GPAFVCAYLAHTSSKPLYDLAKSRVIWRRRIAIVATQHFIRQNDFKDTLKIAKILLQDEEDLIHKAVGWMLREVGERDRTLLVRFLSRNHNKMPRTMLRSAIERFNKSDRETYLDPAAERRTTAQR